MACKCAKCGTEFWAPMSALWEVYDGIGAKADVVAVGTELGVPFELTWSCYEGHEKACGVCGTCRDRIRACAVLRVYDKFLAALVRFTEAAGITLVMTADHGNIENMTDRGHTRNPVPFIAFGPRERALRDAVESLQDVTPSILAAFDAM